jgi:hypothetical protein
MWEITMTEPTSLIVRFRTLFIVGTAAAALALALSAHRIGLPAIAATTSQQLPPGYRDWRLVSVAILGTPFDDIRAKLGNDLAFNAFREGKIPFPDGAMIARLAWKQVRSEVNNNAFRQDPSAEHLTPAGLQKLLSTSFAAGPPTNLQFMIKDSKKYASTGGWGFFQFTNGKPDRIVQASCFGCHAPQKATDFVFTRYSP